jgi:hypothetical protein
VSEGRVVWRVEALALREGDTVETPDGVLVTLGRVSWEPLHSPGAPVVRVRACLQGATVPVLFWLPDERVVRVQAPTLGT